MTFIPMAGIWAKTDRFGCRPKMQANICGPCQPEICRWKVGDQQTETCSAVATDFKGQANPTVTKGLRKQDLLGTTNEQGLTADKRID